jgi:hypothetical protein
MNWFDVMGLASTGALFLPIIVTLALRLAWYKSFPALLIYYIMSFGYNLISLDYFGANKHFLYYFGVANNFMDAPLMLSFMTYFSKTASFRNKMKLLIPAFILFELIVILINGFNIDSAIIALGPGLLTVLFFATFFFFHQAKIAIARQKAVGKTCMVAALIFAYCGYFFIYVVYYLLKTPDKFNTLVIYFLVNIFSSVLISTGIMLERKRVRQLAELQTARNELKVVYGRAEIATAASKKKQPQWKDH